MSTTKSLPSANMQSGGDDYSPAKTVTMKAKGTVTTVQHPDLSDGQFDPRKGPSEEKGQK